MSNSVADAGAQQMFGFKANSFPEFAFCSSPAFECLFGGLPGGGKTMTLAALPLLQANHPRFMGWIFRRNEDDLGQLKAFCEELYTPAGARGTDGKSLWTFPQGGWVKLTHMADERSWKRIRGHNNTFVGFDELNEFLEEQYGMARVWCRRAAPDLFPMVRSTANPDGPGRAWVGKTYIRRCRPFEIYEQTYKLHDGTIGTTTRQFIPSSFRDNPDRDPDYETTLHLIPNSHIRRAFLADDVMKAWEIVIGAFFEFNNRVHVVPRSEEEAMRQFLRESRTTVMESIDWGSRDYFSYHPYVRERDSRKIYVTDEYHEIGDLEDDHIPAILKIREDRLYADIDDTVICSAAFVKKGKRSQSAAAIMADAGIQGRPAYQGRMNDIVQGWDAIHRALRYSKTREPILQIFESCEALIEDMAGAVTDESNVETIDPTCRDHTLEDCRHAMMLFDRSPTQHALPAGLSPETANTGQELIDTINTPIPAGELELGSLSEIF